MNGTFYAVDLVKELLGGGGGGDGGDAARQRQVRVCA